MTPAQTLRATVNWGAIVMALPILIVIAALWLALARAPEIGRGVDA